MTEALWGLTHGRTLEARYPELLKPEPPEETRTAEDVIAHIRKKLEEVG